jgi:SpoVK/Ycf46/Vps4 family AAA+-type ATPase
MIYIKIYSRGRITLIHLSDISALKEMVAIPLLYPELFENFKITPPRGVLFHGPPGTGKTLMGELNISLSGLNWFK